MRAEALAPGAAWPVGQLVFRHKRREVRALLYNRAELVPKRVPAGTQQPALGRMNAARRWCPSCDSDVGYCIPSALGCCVDCAYPDLAQTQVSGATPRTEAEVRDAAA